MHSNSGAALICFVFVNFVFYTFIFHLYPACNIMLFTSFLNLLISKWEFIWHIFLKLFSLFASSYKKFQLIGTVVPETERSHQITTILIGIITNYFDNSRLKFLRLFVCL